MEGRYCTLDVFFSLAQQTIFLYVGPTLPFLSEALSCTSFCYWVVNTLHLKTVVLVPKQLESKGTISHPPCKTVKIVATTTALQWSKRDPIPFFNFLGCNAFWEDLIISDRCLTCNMATMRHMQVTLRVIEVWPALTYEMKYRKISWGPPSDRCLTCNIATMRYMKVTLRVIEVWPALTYEMKYRKISWPGITIINNTLADLECWSGNDKKYFGKASASHNRVCLYSLLAKLGWSNQGLS